MLHRTSPNRGILTKIKEAIFADYFRAVFQFQESANYGETQAALEKICYITRDEIDQREVAHFQVTPSTSVQAGSFFTPSVQELRQEVRKAFADSSSASSSSSSSSSASNNSHQQEQTQVANDNNNKQKVKIGPPVLGEANALHDIPSFHGAVIQAASQYNCLEMVSPTITPELGITRYQGDPTQGPACAIAAAAGTAYRNYLAHDVAGLAPNQKGQSAASQVNTLVSVEAAMAELGRAVPWRPTTELNGYLDLDVSPGTLDALRDFNEWLAGSEDRRRAFVENLRIGVQRDTQVTNSACFSVKKQEEEGDSSSSSSSEQKEKKLVTQTYNAAVSIGYSIVSPADWKPVATTVLEATYEATLLVGLLNNVRRKIRNEPPRPVLLTQVGGGVFRNDPIWIRDAVNKAVKSVETLPCVCEDPLEVRMVVFSGGGSHL